MSATFPFTHSDSSVACRNGVMQTHTHGPTHSYQITVSTDKVMVWNPFRSLSQKTTRHSAQPRTAAEKHRCHCLSKDCACVCVFICNCSGVQQMPLFEMSLKCVPDRQLAPPYLPTAMPPQLASNQYLLQPAMNRYEPSPHLCSAT